MLDQMFDTASNMFQHHPTCWVVIKHGGQTIKCWFTQYVGSSDIYRLAGPCLKDNPVLLLSTTHIIMTAGRCTFWGCDRTRWNHLCFLFALPDALQCFKLFVTPANRGKSIEKPTIIPSNTWIISVVFFRCNEMHKEFHVFRAIRTRGFHWLSYAW